MIRMIRPRFASPRALRIERFSFAVPLVLAAVVGLPQRAYAQNQATTFPMTTGGVTRALVDTTVGVSGTITNSIAPGGSNLSISLSSGGALLVTNLGSNTNSLAPQASTAVSGSIQAGSLAGAKTWSVINTDASAVTTTSTASGSLQVVDQRVFNVTTGTIALGRYLRTSTPTTGTTNVTSTGTYAMTASGSLGNFSNSTSNGLTLTLNSGSANFAGAASSQTSGYQLGGTVQDFAAGVLSGSFTSNVTAEFGSISPVVVSYTGTAVSQRVFTTSTSTLALGYVHQGATLSLLNPVPSVGVTSTGRNATTANGTLGSFTGGPAGLSLGLTSGSAQFSGATSSQTATYSIAGTASTLGSVSGTYTSAVTAEFGSIPNVTVAVTGQIYSGLGTWNTNSGGNWGTISGTDQNAFGSNWGDNQGSPGLDQNYTNTDTATFGSALTSGTAVVNTNGATISLKALTFDNANGHYALYQTNGSSFISLVGSGTSASAINVVAGNHAIHADIQMNSSMGVDSGANSSLTIHNAISGGSAFSLTKTGDGVLTLSGSSTYSGSTTVSAGTLFLEGRLNNSAVTVHSGATFGGSGSLGSSLTVESGAFLAPGGVSPGSIEGVLTVGSLNLNAGSSTAMQIAGDGSGSGVAGTGYDSIVVSGSDGLSYGGELSLMFSNASDFVLGTTFNLFSHSGSAAGALEYVTAGGSGNYAGLSFTSDGNGVWTSDWVAATRQMLVFTESTGNLVVVPEPSTWAMALAGLACGGYSMFRRKKVAGKR